MSTNGHIRQIRENSVAWLVKQMSQRMDTVMASQLADLELDLRQFKNLITLFENDNLNQVVLARRVGEAGYAMSRQIDGLEKRGLVVRQRDPDSRRAHRVLLTNEGRTLAEKLPPIVSQVNAINLELLSEEERELLVSLLKKALNV